MNDRANKALDLEQSAFFMPYTANREFKKSPRLLERAEGMYYYTPEGRSLQRPLRDSQIDATLSTTTGGLRPEHLVNPEAQTRLRVALDASGSFTTFATEYTRREKVTADFDVTNSLLDVFRGWLGERRIQPGVNEWLTDTAWIRNRLRQEILNQGVSVERGDEIELARDPLIGRAIDLIRTVKVN